MRTRATLAPLLRARSAGSAAVHITAPAAEQRKQLQHWTPHTLGTWGTHRW